MTGTRAFYFTLYVLAVNAVTAQEIAYELINQMFQTETNTIKLKKQFTSIVPDTDYLHLFEKENLKEIWGPHFQTQNSKWPDLDTFLTHISISSFLDVAKQELSLGFDKKMDTSKLNSHLKLVTANGIPDKYGDGYFIISRPYFNCDKDWAMISVSSVFFGGASGNTVHIYQKVRFKWVLFHKLLINNS